MYQVPNSAQQNPKVHLNPKVLPSNNTFFYNPLGQNPSFPLYKPQSPCYQTAIQTSFAKNPVEKINVSGNASTEYSTPRMINLNGIQGFFLKKLKKYKNFYNSQMSSSAPLKERPTPM